MRHLAVVCCLLLLAGLMLTGCAPRIPHATPADGLPPPVTILEPGDIIQIKFRHWPELDQVQAIRPDGKISLEMVQDVQAAGSTPEDLSRALVGAYDGKLKDPVITVIVREMVNQKVFVGGEVLSPGVIPLFGRMTVMEAVMAAGGPNKRSARLSDVVLVRRTGDKNHAVKLDLRKPLRLPESESIYLAPHDIVFVPRTRIDALNQFVEQYINRAVPETFINYSHQLNPRTTIGYGTR